MTKVVIFNELFGWHDHTILWKMKVNTEYIFPIILFITTFATFSICANELPCRCTDDCDDSCCEVFCKESPSTEPDIHQNITKVLLQQPSPNYFEAIPSITTSLHVTFSFYTEGRSSPLSPTLYSNYLFTRD